MRRVAPNSFGEVNDMENGGASYSPQTTKVQVAPQAQTSYNMPGSTTGPPKTPTASIAASPTTGTVGGAP